MKTKQQIIDRIIERWKSTDINSMDKILTEELPDFNPNRIDEERFKELWGNKSLGYNGSMVQQVIQEYNSTLPSPLIPLPKEMPAWFNDIDVDNEDYIIWEKIVQHYGTPSNNLQPLPKDMPKDVFKQLDKYKHWIDLENKWHWHFRDLNWLWKVITSHYGTPSKPDLPSVEELEKELSKLWGKDIEMIQKGVAKYLHSKYSLPPKQEDVDKLKEELENERIRHAACGTAALGYFTGCHEKYLSASLQDVINLRLKYEGLLNKQKEEKVFPFNLKDGDKFKWEKEVQKFKKFRTYLVDEDGITYLATTCTPYTPPTAQDIISKYGLTEEEVRVIREGKS
jgi:hypothetical protein